MVLLPAVEKSSSKMSSEVTKLAKVLPAVSGPESPYKPSKVDLKSINPYITCNLCKGYLIDATTIVECLHSFCHSCIMKHLRTEQYCPQCEMMINKAKPNIKPDATLQAIVYKLVPGLYERELIRKRAFYKQHPEKAALATPEQRGEDTEHLIFSPSDKMSLTLEYADKELAENNEELERPKVLMCPAVFTVAHLKKFIINKYSIPTHQFYVEIMYKVQTITLPDHYTLMDVAYIYTWKKDAHMRFFYRIRTHEMKPVELPEVPLRRSPSLSAGSTGGRNSSSLTTIKEEDADSKESLELIKPSDIKLEEEQQNGKLNGTEVPSVINSSTTAANTNTIAMVKLPIEETFIGRSTTNTTAGAVGVSEHRHQQQKAKVDVKPNVAALGKYQQESRTGESKMESATGSPDSPKVVKKNESIKLKIEMNKNTYNVSILQSPHPLDQEEVASKHHKSDKPEKAKKKKSEDKEKSVNKVKASSDLKIKIEKVKDGLVSVKSGKKVPYKVELTGLSDLKNNNHKISHNDLADSKKARKEAHKLEKSEKKIKSPKRNPEIDNVHPSIVLKIDQKSPELSTSTLKIVSHPLASSSPKPKPEPVFEDEKSQFLNSFELTPIKSVGGESRSPSKSPISGGSPPRLSIADIKPGKRKNKEPSSNRSVLKKPKLSDDEMKALVEKKVQESIKSTGEHILPLTSSLKPKQGTEKSAIPILPHQPPKVNNLPKEASKPESKPKPVDFKAPSVMPPPVVSTTNIPAPKPAQPVMIAPKPVNADASKRPAVPSFPKPMQPAKKLPPLLPKDLEQAKINKPKRPQQNAGPTIHISPNKETEISEIKPEDAKKNIKVYGPPSDGETFAVPSAPAMPKPKPNNKTRPVNYLNYALMNANKAPAGSRTPIPSYCNSPSYSPDSPQYNPNFNISTKQYKYANPLAYANHLQTMLNDRRTGNKSPPSTTAAADKKPESANEKKRPCPSPENNKQEPPMKQPKVQSLLNQ
ncbi:polycomb group protein Psc, partial [Uranotaenia lowii]|uniref:polycomb group protein Psc n=1 Tax=Uranotaenia lowii TaxID=190385 RepID=UPI0024789844